MSRYVSGSAALLLLALVAGCADPIKAARNATATAASIQKDMLDQFVSWDREHQAEINAQHQTREAAKEALKAYREKRATVVKSFEGLWLSIVSTETATNLAEAGQKNKTDLIGYIAALSKTINDLIEAARALGVPVPNTPGVL